MAWVRIEFKDSDRAPRVFRDTHQRDRVRVESVIDFVLVTDEWERQHAFPTSEVSGWEFDPEIRRSF